MNLFLAMGSTLGFCSVALGAFGAHALKDVLSPYQKDIYTTATHYMMIHALALLFVSLLPAHALRSLSGYFFLAGTVIFSGTLLLIVFTSQKWWGAITPIGGLCLLVAWALLAFLGFKS